MILSDFETTTHGKWILAGEHAVLRGHEALVFPILEKKLTLRYRAAGETLHANYDSNAGEDMHLLFWSVLEQGLQILGKSLNQLHGHFHLDNHIPIGVGMGASAALCVAMARWFDAQSCLTPAWDIPRFAKELEHLFHGKSSGLDIVGVASTSGVSFKEGQSLPMIPQWKPHWFLSPSGQIGMTSHCIQQVQTLWDQTPMQGLEIDKLMTSAVEQAACALKTNRQEGIRLLAEAINQACACFQAWGLINETLQQHINQLKTAGAIAAKPTGSGGGGYVISLWDKPPEIIPQEWIKI